MGNAVTLGEMSEREGKQDVGTKWGLERLRPEGAATRKDGRWKRGPMARKGEGARRQKADLKDGADGSYSCRRQPERKEKWESGARGSGEEEERAHRNRRTGRKGEQE